MRKQHENFYIFHVQKGLVSAETIRGNTVYLSQLYNLDKWKSQPQTKAFDEES